VARTGKKANGRKRDVTMSSFRPFEEATHVFLIAVSTLWHKTLAQKPKIPGNLFAGNFHPS
jgi:hypothetical protein